MCADILKDSFVKKSTLIVPIDLSVIVLLLLIVKPQQANAMTHPP
jgi:hypothetical protein